MKTFSPIAVCVITFSSGRKGRRERMNDGLGTHALITKAVTVYISPCHLLATGCCQGADMVSVTLNNATGYMRDVVNICILYSTGGQLNNRCLTGKVNKNLHNQLFSTIKW
ncbi:hypothetical protein OUZ56_025232 [Daphnia magna]|uniref:Uncharacterized protein n=1 Tax=Daphnia magna TaxID=35525 RepID=A0ABQ9ZK91_9CRUS|nr:hypothetical protein OUZ56_025232 [Daphnia magna]